MSLWLRAEAVAVFGLSLALYWHTGTPWWIFLALFFSPDLSMLFYLVSQQAGSTAYNLAHNYIPALTLLIAAVGLNDHSLLPFAAIWTAHIAFDRALGYGLKIPGTFRETHLGPIGRSAS
jgi:hypothetical protein